MILHGLRMADDGQSINVRINKGKIDEVTPAPITEGSADLQLRFDNAMIFPGLINSHDHLDFNLFPQLGNRIYKNYTEWGAYIHQQYKSEINHVLRVPAPLRIRWGIYKNLLCGVTTVVNHGEPLALDNALISIFEETHDLHSVGFEKLWWLKLNNPSKRHLPVAIHIGEGTDDVASTEIDSLIRWNKWRRPLIGIHAVAMNGTQASNFKGIVWCPESNYYLLNKTAPVHQLKQNTTILFGTDSTLTGNWNIWDHMAMARKTGLLTDEELYQSLNSNAAKVWQMNTGSISIGMNADLVIARRKDEVTGMRSFYGLTPADLLLVMHQGNVRLFDQELLQQLAPGLKGRGFSLIRIEKTYKYVEGNLGELMGQIHSYLPEFNFPLEFMDHQIF
ncbi:amidohydrolase family protein [Mucilaginibacter lappiensis]|uniref:Cytosine/adenosine deaminase-related metal-dependent hydrolase n=1 Tax=Mucilaginibacter lappiensis TaxID=354630 RepID=A0A841JAA8_9SPHI|nr:amidohydrolase family protein [Mucilaginibacter lappiensis]MBB6127747.1 cytosine/adenosine deaminase-related metal-dependent hydrolase [Mucilaginibacter lappiensis]